MLGPLATKAVAPFGVALPAWINLVGLRPPLRPGVGDLTVYLGRRLNSTHDSSPVINGVSGIGGADCSIRLTHLAGTLRSVI